MALFDRIFPFQGGLKLQGRKSLSAGKPTAIVPLPRQLILPLQQHIGTAGRVVVQPGDRVLKGQLLAEADGFVSAALHAPTSGVVAAIESRPIIHPSGLSALCLVLDSDGEDRWSDALPPPVDDFTTLDPAEIRRRVRDAGIVGLGGAAFPTAVKLNPVNNARLDLLIINGIECEPYITCDDQLMRDRAAAVIGGVLIIRHALGVDQTLVAVEDDKPEAAAALKTALDQCGATAAGITLRTVPTRYPSGGEKQLIHLLTGREVPSHGLPSEIGVVCQNVGTAAAVYEAIVQGRPLISRYVAVTGEGIREPQVVNALIGTPISELVAQCGGYHDQVERLIAGGPMMGIALDSDRLPLTKGSNCILATAAPAATTTLPCIRCGACAEACPAQLLPQQLYWYARNRDFDKTQDYKLFDCIECGCCAAVCPSQLPLVQYYRYAKTEIGAREQERRQSDIARQRHQARQARLELEKQQKAERLKKKQQALQQNGNDSEDPKKSAIAAALARAKAKKNPVADTVDD